MVLNYQSRKLHNAYFWRIARRDLINYLKQRGFDGPYAGSKHQYMQKGDLTVRLPNSHPSDIGRGLLAEILRQAMIERDEWESL